MWNRSDVDSAKVYRVQLCHAEGERYFALLEEGGEPRSDCMFYTEHVPRELLRSRNLIRIAREVRLVNGARFVVDAHGVWLTESEVEAMRRGLDHDAIAWVTGSAPRFAPK